MRYIREYDIAASLLDKWIQQANNSGSFRTKENVIRNNSHKYSVSAMCKVLQISRSTYYYEVKQKPDEIVLVTEIKRIFKESRNNYGSRKIKIELEKAGYRISRRKIRVYEKFSVN